MPIILDKEKYELAKQYANSIYKKNSAYKSLAIQKYYKILGGRYGEDYKERKLSRWLNEEWKDYSNLNYPHYPVYRPTYRINKNSPLTINEIDEKNLKQQIKLKQKYKGAKNLPKFKKKV
jgi:hypothetical protein